MNETSIFLVLDKGVFLFYKESLLFDRQADQRHKWEGREREKERHRETYGECSAKVSSEVTRITGQNSWAQG